jgi:hypothetical protein
MDSTSAPESGHLSPDSGVITAIYEAAASGKRIAL